jgi:hypothetical protein
MKASSLASRLYPRLFEGVARLGTVVLDDWSCGGRVFGAARLRALAFDRRLFGGLILRTSRDNAGIRGRLVGRPGAFTRTPSQAKMVLRGLVIADGAVAAGIQ